VPPESAPEVEAQIVEWLAYMRRRPEVSSADTEELEDHLRSRIAELTETGLDGDEAFLVAVKRMGSLDSVTREFAREHSDRLWKQLVLTGEDDTSRAEGRRQVAGMIAFAVGAALLVKLPALVGLSLDDDAEFYAANAAVLGLAPLAGYFLWRRRSSTRVIGAIAALFALGAVAANTYPLEDDAPVLLLTALHLPIALWLVVGVAYADGDWRSDRRRMDFIRFTGEWFLYYVLIALGGGVLTALTLGIFDAIGVDAETAVSGWVLPCGAAGAAVVSAWLVEAKQSVVENMAPVLTRVFTPLFVLALLAFVTGLLVTGVGIDIDRDVLIVFDLLLVVVLGLVLYGVSARDPSSDPTWSDRLQLALVAVALVIDVVVLLAITRRIGSFGFSANKTAALGENLVLLANLGWSGHLLLAALRRRAPLSRLDRWQTAYVPVYAAWAWFVVLGFPLIFGFD
jgi:hypothetical protein